MSPSSRRGFLTASAASLIAAGSPAASAAPDSNSAGSDDLRLGVASYSFREFSRRMAIRMTKELRTQYICIKEFHLPYRSTPQEIVAARKEFEKAGLQIVGGGTIYLLKDEDADIQFYFDYAKACGIPLIVAGPSAQALPRIEKFAKLYDIQVAIHNHGPEDKHFPAPADALKLIKDMDPRMGLCIDVGHTTRTGTDIIQAIREAGPRLLDMHIKDLRNLMDKDSQVDCGEGAMPIPAIFRELKAMKYKGMVNLEYEINGESPMVGMQKSFSYMRGVLQGLRSA